MSALETLIAANFRNSYRRPTALAVWLGLAALLMAGMVVPVLVLGVLPELRSASPNVPKVTHYLGLIAYGSGLLAMGLNLNVFSANNLVREKTQRLFESILAAPVAARTLWLAKTLAVFLPGLVLCDLCASACLLAVNALVIVPHVGAVGSPALVLAGLALVPLVYLPLSGLVLQLALAGNPVTANVVANAVFSASIAIIINLTVRGSLDVASPGFAWAHVVVAAGLGLLVLGLQLRLTRERIVLSCRA